MSLHPSRSDVANARNLQAKMLAPSPELPGFKFATRYQACSDITGDFYEFITLSDGRIGFALGDDSGHGVQAGLIKSKAKKTLEIYAGLGAGPVETLCKVNDALTRDLGGNMFISMIYGILDPDRRSITWARAGGTPALRFTTATGELHEIKPPGMVLGMKAGQTFRQSLKEESTEMSAGQTILLYTDGVTETMNSQQEEWGPGAARPADQGQGRERPRGAGGRDHGGGRALPRSAPGGGRHDPAGDGGGVTMRLQMAALTHKGRVRENNEDSVYFDVRDRIAIVCDGMGGHAGGHIASELAVRVISSGMRQLKAQEWHDEERVVEAMKLAVFSANDHILSRARLDPGLFDMGTTVVACGFMDDRVVTANVGDSRIYRIAESSIEQVSSDHSLVAERVRAGLLDPASEEASLLANIVTRALGMDQITVDITIEDLRPNDVYLLCSDGLCDMVEDEEMLQTVQSAGNLELGCLGLIDLANDRGGVDNVTVSLVRAS